MPALLEEFRQVAYSLLGRAHDATFEPWAAEIISSRNQINEYLSANLCKHLKDNYQHNL